jgi:hypothetical protein
VSATHTEFFEWLSARGVDTATQPRWFFQAESRNGRTARVVHASANCPKFPTPPEGDGYALGIREAGASNFLCESCLPALLGLPLDGSGEETVRILRGLKRTSEQVELAGSTFHVMQAEQYPALHAAVIHDVAPKIRRAAAGATGDHPLVVTVKETIRRSVDELEKAHPFDADAALRDAVLVAARWKFSELRRGDLFDLKLGNDYDAVQTLGVALAGSVRKPGEAQTAASRLVDENRELTQRVPALGGILSKWADAFDAYLRDTALAYFVCGGLSDHPTVVPRTAHTWLIQHKLRAQHSVWGIGEMPRIVREYLTYVTATAERSTRVSAAEAPHQELTADQWSVAMQLWCEHKNLPRSEYPLADPAQAITAAAGID